MLAKKKIIDSVTPEPTTDVISVPKSAYKNVYGSFGIATWAGDKITSIQWEGCRDRFQGVSEPEAVMDFFFYHNDDTAHHVIDFMRTVEKIIELQKEDQLEFQFTNNSNILNVKMSKWWKYKLRRSLLTALLRCGQSYVDRTTKGFEKALYSVYYTAQTRPAIEQFLKGRTGSKLKKQANFSGWYAQFVNKNELQVRETLVKVVPKSEEEKAEAAAEAAKVKAEAAQLKAEAAAAAAQLKVQEAQAAAEAAKVKAEAAKTTAEAAKLKAEEMKTQVKK